MNNYQILKKPVITEKSMGLVSQGQYTFEVDRRANKHEVATAVARNFGVTVEKVRTFTRLGKTKQIRRVRATTKRPDRKFAIVKLMAGQKIEGFEKLLEVDENESIKS